MEYDDKLSRLLAQKQTPEDIQSMLLYYDSWVNVLMGLWMENIAETNRLVTASTAKISIFEKLGRDGRRLKAMATESLADAYSALSKKRLAIERGIETLGKAQALADAESKHRINLSNYLLEEVLIHKRDYEAHPEEANSRLWAAIEGAHL